MEEGSFDTHYLCNHGFAYSGCNIYPKPLVSSRQGINPKDYSDIKNGDIVYIITPSFQYWFQIIYPTLKKANIKIILVSGDCDRSAPLSLFNFVSNDIQVRKTFVHDLFREGIILHWFCQNCDYPDFPCVTPVPIGIDYHTIHRRDYWGESQTHYRDQDLQLQELYNTSIPWDERSDFILMDAHLTSHTNPTDRKQAYNLLKDKDYVEFLPKGVSRTEYWKKLRTHKYVVSPLGNGMDCHRTWEALCLGVIPIIKKSTIETLFTKLKLPVIQVDSYDMITPELVKTETLKIKENTPSNWREYLTLTYWIQQFKNIQNKYMISDKILKSPSSSEKTVWIAFCIRNGEKYLHKDGPIHNVIHRIYSLLILDKKMYSKINVIFVESDSEDKTVETLSSFCDNFSDISSIHIQCVNLGNLRTTIPSRTMRLAYCRNIPIQIINNTDKNQDDILMWFDADASKIEVPDTLSSTIQTFLKEPDTAAIFGTTATYYDIWALRGMDTVDVSHWTYGSNKDCIASIKWERFYRMRKLGEFWTKPLEDEINRNHVWKYKYPFTKLTEPDRDSWIPVISAFNGFGIYKTIALENVEYYGQQFYQIKFGDSVFGYSMEELCEHVHLNSLLYHRGWKLYISPELYIGSEMGK